MAMQTDGDIFTSGAVTFNAAGGDTFLIGVDAVFTKQINFHADGTATVPSRMS